MVPLIYVIVHEVVSRYIFNRPPAWAFELSLFLGNSFCIIGGAYCLLHAQHVRIDVLWGRFSKRGKAILDLVTFVLFFLFVVALLWFGWQRAWFALQWPWEVSMTPWAPILWPFRISVPIGALLLLLQGIAKFIRDFGIATTGRGGD